MVWIVFTLGSLSVVMALLTLTFPKILGKILSFFSKGNRLYLLGILRTTLGIMLLILSPQARLWWYVIIIGFLYTASGLSFFFFALRRTKKILSRFTQRPAIQIRTYAFIALAMWVFLFYALSTTVATLGLG